MRIAKSTRYALYAALEMASAGDRPVTVVQAAERWGVPSGALAKVFQQLVRVGLATGTRGIGGGYRLARRARDVTVLDVVNALQPVGEGASLLLDRGEVPTGTPSGDRLRRLFEEVDEMAISTLASVSLETLARRPRPAGTGA